MNSSALKILALQLSSYEKLNLVRVPADPEPFKSSKENKPDSRELDTIDPIFRIYREKVVKVRVGPEEALQSLCGGGKHCETKTTAKEGAKEEKG